MSKLESTLNEEKVRYNRIEKQVKTYINDNNLNSVKDLNEDDIDKIIIESEYPLVNESRTTLYSNIGILNDILEKNNSDIRVNSSDYVNKLKFNSGKYFTKREIQQLCDAFENAQDKFIVYALWNGIMGKDYTDLLNLKVTDIVKDDIGTPLYINLPNRRVKCDEFMQEIIQDVLEDNIYYQYTECADKSYELNMNSEYIIKVKPTKKTNDGLNHMNKTGVQTRLAKLNSVFKGELDDIKIHLTGKSLERSGLMYDLFMKEVYEQKEWTISEIDKYLKLKGIKGSINDIYRCYHQKYHDSTILEY